jgi:fused signal recognition particle receptor
MLEQILLLDDAYLLIASAVITAAFLIKRVVSPKETESLKSHPNVQETIEVSKETIAAVKEAIKVQQIKIDSEQVVKDSAVIVEPTLKEEFESTTTEQIETAASVKDRLTKSRSSFFGTLRDFFRGSPTLSVDALEELQYLLVSADLGIKTASRLIEVLKNSLSKGESINEEILIARLKEQVLAEIDSSSVSTLEQIEGNRTSPIICLIVGVNGVGKTTTTAKLAARVKERGAKVLLVAADTFRAAAVEQLQTWGTRLDIPVVFGAPDAKPQTVVFEAMKRAKEESFDLILIDTAGRLNNKSNLMQELSGVKHAIEKHFENGVDEVLLVVDGTTGQNAVSQAKEFHAVVQLTGLIVTKLDGSPKGGVVLAVKEETSVPVRYIGVGEAAADLRPFDAHEFVEALFAKDEKLLENESAHAATRRRKRNEAA